MNPEDRIMFWVKRFHPPPFHPFFFYGDEEEMKKKVSEIQERKRHYDSLWELFEKMIVFNHLLPHSKEELKLDSPVRAEHILMRAIAAPAEKKEKTLEECL